MMSLSNFINNCELDVLSVLMFDCQKCSSIRDDFVINNRIPNCKHMPISTLIIQLMNSTDYCLNKQLVQYITPCLEMRDNLLSKAWYCYLIYFLLLIKCFCNAVSLFYGHANKGSLLLLLGYINLQYITTHVEISQVLRKWTELKIPFSCRECCTNEKVDHI